MRILAILLLLLSAAPLAAQTAPPPAAEAPPAAAPATAPAVSPADIERVLATLRDDAKRADFVATLEALLRAGGAAPPEPETTLIPLPPDSLGAQLLLGVSGRVERLSDQAVAALQAFYDLPGLLAFFERVWESPWLRERALEAAGMVALLLAVGAGAEWLVRRGLAGVRDRLGQAAGRSLGSRLLRTLVRFLLDLVPVAAFMATTYAVVLLLSPQLTTRLILLSVNNAWIVVAVAMCAARALLSPSAPALRLIPFGDNTAAWLVRSLRRILAVSVFGFAAAEAGLVLGMDQVSYAFIGKLVWLLVSIFLVMLVLQCRGRVRAAIRAPDGARGIWAITRNRVAELWHIVAILYVIAAWLVLAMELPNGFERMLQVSIATFVILGVAKGLEDALRRGLDAAFTGTATAEDGGAPMAQRVARYVPAGRRIAIAALWAAAFLLLFQAWGLEPLSWFKGNALGARLMRALANIGVVVGIALLLWEAANAAIERHLATLSRNAQTAKSARVRTLMPMLRTTLLVAIVLVSVLTILSEIGVNVAPLLAGAGVIGIAVGFGSQKLVQDVITGAFLLFEDAIAVGDVVALGGQSGVVEQLSIRSIRLRALDGSIHIIPFSAVTTVTNMTRDYGYAVFDISVSYAADSDRVATVLREIGKEMREEDRWAAVIREPLEVMGIEKLAESTVIVRARFKTDPGSRWAVNREFLRRVKQRFDAEGIELPFPSRRVVVEGPPGMTAAQRDAAAAAG
jgi:small-conductance mechanosensitive channel